MIFLVSVLVALAVYSICLTRALIRIRRGSADFHNRGRPPIPKENPRIDLRVTPISAYWARDRVPPERCPESATQLAAGGLVG